MDNTITGYAHVVFLKLRTFAIAANRRPKTVAISILIALLYLPIAHLGHSFGRSFEHVFEDTFIVQILSLLYEKFHLEDTLVWLLFAVITIGLLYLLCRIVQKENSFLRNKKVS